jgi:hypothetical protein
VATTDGSALRGLSPEAKVVLDGIEYNVGGLLPLKDDRKTPCPQPFGLPKVADNCPTAYFNRSTPYGRNLSAFNYAAHAVMAPIAPFPWSPARHAPPVPWPPRGLQLVVNFTAPAAAARAAHRSVTISVPYELYDGAPIMTKWLSFHNTATDNADDVGAEPPPDNQPPPPLPPTAKQGRQQGRVPPDQQGPICIQPCHLELPASDWESHWILLPAGTAPTSSAASAVSPRTQQLQLAGAMAGRKLCLQIVKAQQFHGGNDNLDVRKCNASEPLQRWIISASSISSSGGSTILSAATAAEIAAVGAPSNGQVCQAPCFIDINNHQSNPGTTLQLSSGGGALWKQQPTAAESHTGPGSSIRGSRSADRAGGSQFLLEALSYQANSSCIWHIPLSPPPAPPPPPPPKPRCTASKGCVVITSATIEILRLNQPWAPVGDRPLSGTSVAGSLDNDDARRQIRTGTGKLFVKAAQIHGSNVSWLNDRTFDPAYAGNIGANEPLLLAGYSDAASFGGPAHRLFAGAQYSTYRVMELWADSVEPERKGLSRRRLTRMLAPQTSEAPLFFHLTDASPKGFRQAIDQMHAVGGFDMLIYSFGSGFQLENTNPAYLLQLKEDIKYARARGIEVGGYDLISDTRGGTGFDTIDPHTGAHDNDACFASGWKRQLTSKVLTQMNISGLSMLETDGPYAGNPCAATDHDHYDAADSVEMQWRGQVEFYALMRQHGVYVHAPDGYLYAGGANKECGGYEENQMSLPRWQWLSIAHQVPESAY